jgi:hypothetical protein
LVPFRTVIQDTGMEHVFNDLVDSLDLTVNLRMISSALDKMGTKTLMLLFLETRNKNRASVRDDGLWDAMIVDNV